MVVSRSNTSLPPTAPPPPTANAAAHPPLLRLLHRIQHLGHRFGHEVQLLRAAALPVIDLVERESLELPELAPANRRQTLRHRIEVARTRPQSPRAKP